MCTRNVVPLLSFEHMKLQNHLGHCWTRISKCTCDERNRSLYLGRKHFYYNLLQQKNSEFCGVYVFLRVCHSYISVISHGCCLVYFTFVKVCEWICIEHINIDLIQRANKIKIFRTSLERLGN